jgi:recombination protein RecA
VKIVKNKTAAPFREAEFDMMYGEGISKEGDLLDLAVVGNLVEKSGSWFSYKTDRIGQGRENAKQFLRDNKDIMAKLEAEVRQSLGLLSVSDKAQAAAANAESAPTPVPKPPAGRK